MFAKRLIEPELLDHCEPDVARPNLADLVRINRRFGGHSTIRYLLRQVASPEDSFSLLDVAAASGDTAEVIKQSYPRAAVTSLDMNAVNLERAPFPKLLADAFALPFGSGSFDFVMSSLFLHHFTDEKIVELLRGFFSVAKRAVLIADLERRLLPYLFLKLSKPILGWNYITVHDGLRSVRAALRAGELQNLAKQAGLQDVRVAVHRPAFRLSLVSLKSGAPPVRSKDEDLR